MRCLSCNKQLTDKEATRKYKLTGEYLDLCDHCLEPIREEIQTVEGVKFQDPDDDNGGESEDGEDSNNVQEL